MVEVRSAAIIRLHHSSLTVLRELDFEVGLLIEGDLDMELIQSVDFVLIARAILTIKLLLGNLEAAASSVAVAVMTLIGWSITLVWGGVPGPCVGLHDVELWAPLSIDHVGIAVVVTAVASTWIAIPVFSWHTNEIKSSITTAARLRKVDVVGDGASKQVDSIEVVRAVVVTAG